jgi:hypothetical protein
MFLPGALIFELAVEIKGTRFNHIKAGTVDATDEQPASDAGHTSTNQLRSSTSQSVFAA